jgi:hypothetical protein
MSILLQICIQIAQGVSTETLRMNNALNDSCANQPIIFETGDTLVISHCKNGKSLQLAKFVSSKACWKECIAKHFSGNAESV